MPKVGQIAQMKLELTAMSGDCQAATIKFRIPYGMSILSRSTYIEEPFAKDETRSYLAEIVLMEEGTYMLSASVSFKLRDGLSRVEHFFSFLIADEEGTRIADAVDALTTVENGIESHAYASLAPADTMPSSLQGRITYYDDNLSRPMPIRMLMVQLFEINQGLSRHIETQYTDKDGLYNFKNINSEYYELSFQNLQLRISFKNDVLNLIDNNSRTYSFDLPSVSNSYTYNDYLLNEANQLRGIGHIFNCIMDAHDFLKDNTGWSRKLISVRYPYKSDNSRYTYTYWINGQVFNESIYIGTTCLWDRVSMLHEYGHSVMMALYGYSVRNFPEDQYRDKIHLVNTVSDSGFAMKEGWAELFESLIDDNAFNTTQYINAKTPNIEYNDWWKGEDGNNANGEMVEGAVASILWDIADTAKSMDEFPDIDDDGIDGMLTELWNLMMLHRPANIQELWRYWIELDYGQKQSLHSIFTNNGVKVSLPWDLNADGSIDAIDIVLCGSYLGQNISSADFNGDGRVNILDLLMISRNIAP